MSEIITVTGNVATDPEQRVVAEGVSVTSFRLASTHRRYDRTSNAWVDAYTNYYSVSAFRALGAHALSSLRRGERVIVSGKFRLREWDNGTRKGVTAEIEAESLGHDLQFATTTYSRDGAQPARPASSAAAADDAPEAAASSAATDESGWAIPPSGESAPALETADTPF
jgi:single-strand DNA-binding protein